MECFQANNAKITYKARKRFIVFVKKMNSLLRSTIASALSVGIADKF